MLAARDQENLVHSQQTLAASKPLNTPGRLLKTPGRHDENAPMGLGGKSVLAKGRETDQFVTPMGKRAPLGMKTTNAKIYQTQTNRPTSARRKQKIHTETVKIGVHTDAPLPLNEHDVEYAPPKVRERPYESDDFPDTLNLDVLQRENLMKGWEQIYVNPVDAQGVTRREKELEESKARAWKAADAKVMKAMHDMDWSISDIPVKATNGPGTMTSRRAASALSVAPPVKKARPHSSLCKPDGMRHTLATAASRSTLGYSKGRTASSAITQPTRSRGLPRSISQSSDASDSTITPARYAQARAADFDTEDLRRLSFLSLFEEGPEVPCQLDSDDDSDEFVMTL